jgi:hypothetical protein
MDKFNGLRSFLDTFSVLYPQLHNLGRTSLTVPFIEEPPRESEERPR